MSNRESLLIDMDGVMADTVGGAFAYVEERYGHKLAHEDVLDYMFSGLPGKDILEAMRSEGFYRHLDVITGAVRGVNRLREEFNGNVYVCSAPMSGAVTSEVEKRDWLAEHFDEDFAREAIITTDKATVPGKVLIEDNPDIIQGDWKLVMFDHPYNRTVAGPQFNRTVNYPRMHGWGDLPIVRAAMRD